MMRKIVVLFLLLVSSWTSFSQINELGIFAGGSNYIGDIGRTNFIYPNSFAFGGIYKWNMHPHYSIRATYIYSKISADDSESDNSFRKYRNLSFENDTHELALGIEYHFFKYNLSKTGHTKTPYLFLEAGVVNYGSFGDTRSFNFTLPFGAGFKARLARNVGIGFETGFRYTFKDDIDGYPTENQTINVQINPNNNDWYVFTGITVVFAFGREGCYTGNF